MGGREDAKGRRRSVLMTPPVPEKVRVLSPAWYRAAVEFQGRPEQERLAFCSWCCCHGGCNLCMDISKGNYIPVYTSLPITITNNHKLYKYYRRIR